MLGRIHGMKRNSIALAILGLVAAATLGLAAGAAAKGLGSLTSPSGVALPGSPFRYQTFAPGYPDELTVITRINREGGKVRRWWSLPGGWYVPAVTPSTGTGLSADGSRLVLLERGPRNYTRPPGDTKLAILRPQVEMRRAAGTGFPHWVDFARLPGEWGVVAISPDGATLFVSRYRTGVDEIRPGLYTPHVPGTDDLEVRAFDTARGRLLPGRVLDRDGNRTRLEGIAYDQLSAAGGRWTYTLYAGDRRRPFVYALDSVTGRGTRIDLPHLHGLREPYALHLELASSGRSVEVVRRWFPDGRKRERTLARIDTASFEVERPQPQAAASRSWWLIEPYLAFAETPRHPGNLLARRDVVGRSAEGRPIGLLQRGDPAIEGELLVFGCVHGDECAGSEIQPLANGCPDPHSDILLVPNLDPDGTAQGTRLNGRGVDLNRNFPSGWKPIGRRGDPEYAGPRPFSEPETRLAARIVRELEPRATVWFHQHRGAGAYVRAWGPSAPAARELARAAGIRFRLMPWLAGTAPNWQNHRFPGAAAFVVELPSGGLTSGLETRLGKALVHLGRKVGED